MKKYMPLAKAIATVAFMIIGVSVAQPSHFQVVHQHPDTSLQIEPESGLQTETETQVDTILTLDPETGLPVNKSGAQPKPPPTIDELGANESTKIQPVTGGRFNLLKRIGGQPFPLRFIGGLAVVGNATNQAISHGFSKGIKISGYRNLYKSFYLYPELTLGFLYVSESQQFIQGGEDKTESNLYGILEGHRRWGMENMRAALFLGVGVGGYLVERDEYIFGVPSSGIFREGGLGLIVSAGAQVSSRTLMGGLYLYRTPGLGKIITVANVGYLPLNYKAAMIVGAGSLALWALLVLLIPGN